MAISIELPDSHLQALRRLAERLGVPVEDLARAVVQDQLSAKEDFEAAAQQVLERNQELYRRLS